MEDAEQEGLSDAAGSPNRAVQLGQSPVELLRLLGPQHGAGLVLLLCSRSIAARTPRRTRPHATAEGDKGMSGGEKKSSRSQNE